MKLMSLMLSLFLASIAVEAPAAEVRIRESATVDARLVRLGDVARISHADPKVEAKLKSLVLGPAPPAGQTVRIDFSAIRSQLRTAGVNLAEVRFSGRTNAIVTRAKGRPVIQTASHQSGRSSGTTTTRKQAEELLAEAIRHHLKRVAENLGSVDVTVELSPADAETVLNARTKDFELTGFQSPLYRPQSLSVRFTDSAGKRHAVRADCHINNKPFVVAAKYRLPRGEIIKPADVTLRQVASAGDAFTNGGLVVGMETNRVIAAGAIIRRGDVRRKPLIRLNQIVDVYSRRPGIVVTRRMTSRGEAALGETIKLYDSRTRQTITAEVIGPQRAEVKPAGSRGSKRRDSGGGVVFEQTSAATRSAAKQRPDDNLRRFRPQRYDKDREFVKANWKRIP